MTQTTRPCEDCGRPFTAGKYARWGLCCRWKHRGKPALYVWTPERDQVLRERYDNRVKGRATELARMIGWPKWAITKRAQRLGLAHAIDRRAWTEADTAFLWEHAGHRTSVWIARELKRSEASVVMKCKHMQIRLGRREGYSLRELELCFGVGHRTIERWVADGKLYSGTHGPGGIRRRYRNGAQRDPWRVTDADLLRFIGEYPLTFELRRVDQVWFLDLILAGGLIRKALAFEREDDDEAIGA